MRSPKTPSSGGSPKAVKLLSSFPTLPDAGTTAHLVDGLGRRGKRWTRSTKSSASDGDCRRSSFRAPGTKAAGAHLAGNCLPRIWLAAPSHEFRRSALPQRRTGSRFAGFQRRDVLQHRVVQGNDDQRLTEWLFCAMWAPDRCCPRRARKSAFCTFLAETRRCTIRLVVLAWRMQDRLAPPSCRPTRSWPAA